MTGHPFSDENFFQIKQSTENGKTTKTEKEITIQLRIMKQFMIAFDLEDPSFGRNTN